MTDQNHRSTGWRGILLSFINVVLKIGLGSIPIIGPAAAKYSAKFRYKITGMLGDKMFVGDKCPWCGGALAPRHSKYGRFIGCSSYPICKYKRNA